MKISLNWLKKYIDLPESEEEISQLLTATGLEVEGLEQFEKFEGGLEGLVIGEVITCELHPNADKLKVTTVDIGAEELSPIVCGAPNVAAGQKVIVATVGTTLYPFEGDSFKIKKAKIRGEVSEGMICAEDEIGLGPDHDGIMVLNTDLPNGTPAAEYLENYSDTVFEIGLTPNRSDAISHLGVARDLKAVLDRDLQLPDIAIEIPSAPCPVEVKVENKEACPRYSGLVIKNLKVADSPEWLQNALKAIGLSPINNVVDITNYVLHAIGQPLHAFDQNKITGNNVIVRTLDEGTIFTTLDEVERKLKANDLMICNADKPMCIGGVFGGIESGVTESTTSIFLESAYFSADYIRKTAQHHQLKTDASFRFERGTDPNNTLFGLKLATKLLIEICGGQIDGGLVDIYDEPIEPAKIQMQYKNIDRLIGKSLDRALIKNILQHLDFEVSNESDMGFIAAAPTYRVDVTREADVIEEILRIYGYDNVEISSQLGSDFIADFPQVDSHINREKIADLLTANGFNEIFTNSLTNPDYTENTNIWPVEENVTILNKLSEELGVMRQTLLFTGLESIRYNVSHRQTDLKFFEFGNTYRLHAKKYEEEHVLALFMTGNATREHWSQEQKPVDFFQLSHIVNKIIDLAGVHNIDSDPEVPAYLQYGLVYKIGKKILATFGKLKDSIGKEMGIKQPVFYAEINWENLLKQLSNTVTYQEVSKYPEVRRDLSLVIDKKVSFKEIKEVALDTEKRLIKRLNVFSVYEGDKIEDGKKAYAISFILQDKDKTLKDKVIDKVMNQLIQNFENNLGALIRK